MTVCQPCTPKVIDGKKAVQIFAPHAASKQHYDNHCISHMLAWMMALGTQYAIKSWKEIAIWKSYNDCYKYFRKNTHFGLFYLLLHYFFFLIEHCVGTWCLCLSGGPLL